MSSDDDSQGESLEERTRQHNSNLQRLIDAMGGLLAASAELLALLQNILSRAQPAHEPADGPRGPDEAVPMDRGQE